MASKNDKSRAAATDCATAAPDKGDRAARLAAALRENLARRKAQQRGRKALERDQTGISTPQDNDGD